MLQTSKRCVQQAYSHTSKKRTCILRQKKRKVLALFQKSVLFIEKIAYSLTKWKVYLINSLMNWKVFVQQFAINLNIDIKK